MPSRIIREGFLDSEPLSRAGEMAEVLFTRLLLVVDDYGRYDGRVPVICRRCWPLGLETDPAPADVRARLSALTTEQLVIPYEVDGKPFIFIPKFRQRLRLKSASKYPDPPELPTGLRASVGQMPDRRPTNDSHPPDRCPPEAHAEAHSEAHAEAQRAGARTSAPPDRADTVGAAALQQVKNLGLDEARIPGGDDTPAGRLAEVLKANSCKGTPFHPLVVEWSREHVTVDQLKRAIATARQRPGKATGLLDPAYLDPILRDVRNPDATGDGGRTKAEHRVQRTREESARITQQPRTAPPAEVMAQVRATPTPQPLRRVELEPQEALVIPSWWETPAGIHREARDLGLEIDDAEEFTELKARVFAAAGQGPWMDQVSTELHERIEHWRTVGPKSATHRGGLR